MATLDLAGIITRVCTDLKLRFAAIIHNHSASDITSGTLPISRGGTGKSVNDSYDLLNSLFYDATEDDGALYLNDSSNLTVGTLPIAQGGTGATSAANARTNLGISGTWYGTSSTTASTAAKVVTCTNFTLAKGAIIAILFTTANTAATPTLNVNSTGTKSIYIGSDTINSTTNTLNWSANTLLYFMYDGTYFRYLGARASAAVVPPDGAGVWYGTSSTAAGTAAKASTIDNFRLMKGAVVSITFSTANTIYGALTLNINSTGAKTIYVNNAATSASNYLLWNAGETLTFVYSGSYWYLISRFLVESDFVKLIDKNIVLPNTNISIADAYNQDTYGGYGSVIFADAYNNQIGYAQTIQIADPDDGMSSKIAIQIGGNNHDEDDYNTLALGFDEDDNPWISLSYPAAFREALGFSDGTWETQYDTGPSVSVANSSWVELTHITLSAGHWLVLVGGYAASNNTGRRLFHLTSASSVTTGRLLTAAMAPSPGGAFFTIIPYLVNPTANTTYNIFGWQNSGGNLNMSALVRAIHIYTA